ncbi:MAG: hypothetical protein ACYCT1_19965, partial [Steroidobacteraceae bacterium]
MIYNYLWPQEYFTAFVKNLLNHFKTFDLNDALTFIRMDRGFTDDTVLPLYVHVDEINALVEYSKRHQPHFLKHVWGRILQGKSH